MWDKTIPYQITQFPVRVDMINALFLCRSVRKTRHLQPLQDLHELLGRRDLAEHAFLYLRTSDMYVKWQNHLSLCFQL